MHILFDGNWNNPEIEISDSWKGLIKLGNIFFHLDENITVSGEHKESDFYPENIDLISAKLNQGGKVVQITLIKDLIGSKSLVFEGSKQAFQKLGRSLLNYFNENSQKNEHFHLDYVEGNLLLAPTNCCIIFLCTGE